MIAGSFGMSRVTITLCAVSDDRTKSCVRLSYWPSTSVKSRPNDAALVTSRGWPAGSGMSQTYDVWVCPLTTMSTAGSSCCAIGTMSPVRPVPGPPALQS